MSRTIRSKRFISFIKSEDTFRVYKGSRLLFSSVKDRLHPVLEYIDSHNSLEENVTVYDRTIGNAAALLLQKIKAARVLAELGSENAIQTLRRAGIKYNFNQTVPCIMNDAGTDMCPMEKLSLGKKPDEFYAALKSGQGVKK